MRNMDLLPNNITASEFFTPVLLSFQVAAAAGFAVIILGTLAGAWMARARFFGKTVVETIIMLPLVLPPTVVGFILIVIFGKHSIAGQAIEWLFDRPVIFTWWAAVIASAIVAFPLMYQSAKTGFADIDPDIQGAAKIDGAGRWQVFMYISVPLAFKSLLSGSILSLARALGEFGATLMFAGNIPGVTQTLPTAIYVAMDSGSNSLAWAWVICIIVISFIMLFLIQLKKSA
ncbi:molybdate ABC transporter permease subunit [Bacillus atrophaeus]|uniref:molybdate ABC transporter permease subunit n=1 Tax=Bacillus atrophaeus TaxID=1452 RepID=UPI002DBAB386|nr:molybdate ABC transporter permease subunit [Bacillus atrophaeus]MEC1901257.1 molybdate ABC transporter permease subunit [Bacillus atrophaeus]MEC2396423.1 molybdate ABC transporter permease subunit [Bacillus atrophaeus]MED4433809.1 molybdate ABC transporter permease subunit [Bacillus atrophaeus]MED4564088.1 molybdate ABC transporter permease subunit [Bacillus atrophaeus]MED4573659.1 molybdate ABC transporter permease subunit [Bacillus atrophaeus]